MTQAASKPATKTLSKANKQTDPKLENVTTIPNEDIETAQELIHVSADIFSGLAKCQQEMISFYSNRIISDLEHQQKLWSCQSIGDALELQQKFIEQSTQQYSDEANRLLQLGAQIIPNELTGFANQINS